ncbi:MAG: hypothetical protein PUF50_02355 [Erysipelotrichaceae bacterium]|nr:hypothetical protein [Erysipelotrichaceae bacterium]
MDLLKIIELILALVLIALIVSIVTRYTCEGIFDALGIENVLVKRLLVIIINALLLYYIMFILAKYRVIEFVIALLFASAGADALHKAIKAVNEARTAYALNDIPPNVTEYNDESVG